MFTTSGTARKSSTAPRMTRPIHGRRMTDSVPSTTAMAVEHASDTPASLNVSMRPLEMKPQFSMKRFISRGVRPVHDALEARRDRTQKEHEADINDPEGREHLERAKIRGHAIERHERELRQADCLQVRRVLQLRDRG